MAKARRGGYQSRPIGKGGTKRRDGGRFSGDGKGWKVTPPKKAK